MNALRRFYWQRIRRYSYEICDRCGRRAQTGLGGLERDSDGLTGTTYWLADNSLWNFVIGGPEANGDPGGIRCPRCFEAECRAQGICIGWRADRVGVLDARDRAPAPPFVLTEALLERGGVALVNADALEPYDRTDGRWRPAVLAEAVLRAALGHHLEAPQLGPNRRTTQEQPGCSTPPQNSNGFSA